VRARWAVPLILALLPAAVAGGCGGVSISPSQATGNQLAIYSSLPLQGPSAHAAGEMVNGERLALAQAGGHVGHFRVGFVSLDDVNPATGTLDPGITASNAKMAAQDTSTIAYVGEYSSAATAVSLPLINAAGILQVSPGSPYVGLTSSLDAGQYEPQRFYPSGRRTFGRLQPGDRVQAAAQVSLMRTLGVHSVYVLDDQNPFEIPLAQLVAQGARRAGIGVAGRDSIGIATNTAFTGEVEKVLGSGAQALFFAGGAESGAVSLWRALHAADPSLVLLGSSAMISEAFTRAIGAAAARTYLTTPALSPAAYPPAAASMLAEYRRAFGRQAGAYALYGYEAMSVVLEAIRHAGGRGNDRTAVIRSFFGTRDRNSVIGTYSILPDGETTLSQYGVERVQNGKPVFYRTIQVR
jgi:branched-chain amino acid transport system substrate-binding protein